MSTAEASAPSWARGLDVAFLKAVAVVFKRALGPHSYGAVGVPKERDIATAHADGNLIWVRRDGAIVAAAIFRVLKADSTHEDFAGRRIKMRRGDLFIRSIGASDFLDYQRLINTLTERCRPPSVWIEAHVENQIAMHALADLRFGREMTKISASSDLKGLFHRGQISQTDYPPDLDPADVPGAKIIALDFLSPAVAANVGSELARGAAWAQHYSSYNKRKSWTAFALCGYDAADPGFIIKPSEMSQGWKAENPQRLDALCLPTVAAARFPAAMAVAARIPGQKQRVRFMRLSAKVGELTRHSDITDPEAGTRNGQIMRLHVPIRTDPRCLFRSWALDGTEHQVHFPERALCYLDTRKPHAVINPADIERIHLVIDVHATPGLRKLIA